MIVVRSPGRINILGRHIDWQGGHCNLMAVDQEAILVASPGPTTGSRSATSVPTSFLTRRSRQRGW